jgi:NitT/TauT family transport system permease protein
MYTCIPLIVILILWEFVFVSSIKEKYLYATPSLIWSALAKNIQNGVLIKDIITTLTETSIGFIIGNFLGTIIGLSLWFSKRIAFIAKPYILVIGTVPVFAVAPLMIIWFGIGLFAKIIIVAISTIAIAITQSYNGAQSVEHDHILLLKSLGASRLQIFRKLLLPSSLIWVYSSLKMNVGFAILGTFIAEYLSSDDGLAHRIFKAAALYDTPLVFAAIICLMAIAIFFNFIISLTQKLFLKFMSV